MLELATDDAFGRQPKAVAIKGKGSFKIGDAQRQDGNSWLHVDTPLSAPAPRTRLDSLGPLPLQRKDPHGGGRANLPEPDLFQTVTG
ncbi:hypothetical protein PDE01_26380 [Paracoccus denitrificans]|nr:hypothetical protein PDE01_26380 [Paracoccus denitrificans]